MAIAVCVSWSERRRASPRGTHLGEQHTTWQHQEKEKAKQPHEEPSVTKTYDNSRTRGASDTWLCDFAPTTSYLLPARRQPYSRGRPSPRWAMMLRWISLVPAEIVQWSVNR